MIININKLQNTPSRLSSIPRAESSVRILFFVEFIVNNQLTKNIKSKKLIILCY